ncbi:MAG TPA: DUF488 domain-containing protein [bacterium]|nr:DUF488 domain-containing protein [bacterium]
MKTIYTIGYSGFRENLNGFISTLKNYRVDVVIDVRSRPYSSQFSEFNKEYLSQKLEDQDIVYRNYAEEFGARQRGMDNYSKAEDILEDEEYPIARSNRVDKEELNKNDEIIDYNKFIKTQIYLSGVKKLNDIYDENSAAVLMCSEKDPINCHRAIMIAKGLFYNHNYEVKHIIPENNSIRIETQTELEERLIEEFEKKQSPRSNINQLDLFGNATAIEEAAKPIERYYRKKNILIGWKYTTVNNKEYEMA